MAGAYTKGAVFERTVAAEILRYAPGYGRKDCFRRPRSGGHPYVKGGDLIISKAFRQVFPFAVECKHYKNFKPEQVFGPTKQMTDWCAQVTRDVAKSKVMYYPLVVVRGQGGLFYAASPARCFREWDEAMTLRKAPAIVFYTQGEYWRFLPLHALLERLKRTIKAQA